MSKPICEKEEKKEEKDESISSISIGDDSTCSTENIPSASNLQISIERMKEGKWEKSEHILRRKDFNNRGIYFGSSKECLLHLEGLKGGKKQGRFSLNNNNYYVECCSNSPLTYLKVPNFAPITLHKGSIIQVTQCSKFCVLDLDKGYPWNHRCSPWIVLTGYDKTSEYRKTIYCYGEREFSFGISPHADYILPKAFGTDQIHFRIGFSLQYSWYIVDGTYRGPSFGTKISLNSLDYFPRLFIKNDPMLLHGKMELEVDDTILKVIKYIMINYI